MVAEVQHSFVMHAGLLFVCMSQSSKPLPMSPLLYRPVMVAGTRLSPVIHGGQSAIPLSADQEGGWEGHRGSGHYSSLL